MRRTQLSVPAAALLLVLAVACAVAPVARADVLDTVTGAIGNAVGAVGGALSSAWDSVKGAVSSAYTTAECKVVDWTTTNLDVCAAAPADNLCSTDCKAQLDKLPGSCAQKILDTVAGQGNANLTTRWEDQLTACNITYNKPTNAAVAGYGSILLPLVVMFASVAVVELLRP